MDPVSLIVAAVVAGAAAGLQEQAQATVRDAYQALKRLVLERHKVDVEPVERKPESEAKRDSLREDLRDAGVADDTVVLDSAQRVVDEARNHQASVAAARAVGIDLDDVAAGFMRFARIDVRGQATAVDMDRVQAPGGITVEDIRVDGGSSPSDPR
ncbi:hypothetical protein P3H15_28295 [Rhodococcus sp. T2V]|uniref:hypothetical protein n=1 Tax=Rhodococcus sp. T2V TaxID=3034164 RepID=UPI0023E1575C|nr:hypothetical protein [Rhodococcus sp. T2V]MDF3308919.1 hypothetical protein [Rhodococcus sp. T2V]